MAKMALDSDKFDARFALESYLHGATPEYIAERQKISVRALRRWLDQRGYTGKRLEHPPIVMAQSGLFTRENLLNADAMTAEQVQQESDHILEAIVRATELLKKDVETMKHPRNSPPKVRTAHMPYVPHAIEETIEEDIIEEEEEVPKRPEVKLPPPPIVRAPVRAPAPPREVKRWSPEDRHPQLTDSAPAFKVALKRMADEKRAKDAAALAEVKPVAPPSVEVAPEGKKTYRKRKPRIDLIMFRAMYDEGYTAAELAEEFKIGTSSAYKYIAEYKTWLKELADEDGDA